VLAVIHAEPRIEWQARRLPQMLAGLKALGVSCRVTGERTRQEGLPILFGTTMWRAVEATGPYLLVDRCSFGDTNDWVSLVRDGHGRRGDHRVPAGVTGDRWKRHGVPITPWHNGKRIVLCGQTETYSPHWKHPGDWYANVVATHFRRHPAGDNPTGLPETRSWKDCGLAVTLNSSVAVEAVLAGVPTVTMDEGAMAWAVTSHDPAETLRPVRSEWLAWLAWTQWRWNEIEAGKPWEHLL
jgi:hypothetical protein